MKNKNLLSQNPITTQALAFGFAGVILSLVYPSIFIVAIPMIFGARKLLKAKKINENKNFITFAYIVVYIPILLVGLSVILSVLRDL